MRHVHIHVTGIVQGVGMRPFVYREAIAHGICGWVLNAGDGPVPFWQVRCGKSRYSPRLCLVAAHVSSPCLTPRRPSRRSTSS